MAGKIAIAVLVAGAIAAGAFAIFGGSDQPSIPDYTTIASVAPDLTGADPRLKRNYAQASKLIQGGDQAFRIDMNALHGLPVVANKWGSWCDPCRREFPSFQGASKALGNKVVFLGVNVQDSTAGATDFLKQFPVPYPSYVDRDLQISRQLKPASFAPVTGFYDKSGKLVHLHAGPYDTVEELKSDVEKYLLGGGSKN